ncbi:MAG: hypothetical protein JWP89_758 [Schlesneria sp.]|nr:hypothetical protein [Schlesneria sp.]
MDIHILDVGNTKYGDCIVLHKAGRWILIDAAHPGDSVLITKQLRKLFGTEPPFAFNLLIVTHCHLDHIGCLPALVANSIVTFEKALVADERLGFGRSVTDDSPVDALPSALKKVVLGLQEEPVADGTDEEIRQFMDDAATLESKYKEMLASFATSGTTVVRYGRDSTARVTAIENAFSDFGLKILGPTQDHLLRCAQVIADSVSSATDSLRSSDAMDGPGDIVSAYRSAVRSLVLGSPDDAADELLEDRAGVGAAKNNQSIVLKVADQGKTALLAGDMQFAKPELPGLEDDMTALRANVLDNGPYDFIKLTHHSSYNGFDIDVWNEWATPSDTYIFAHTGGKNDSGHPDVGVLELLHEYRDQLQFARTDRNGQITIQLAGSGVIMDVARGQINNFARNQASDIVTTGAAEPASLEELPVPVVRTVQVEQGVIQLTAKVPPNATRVTITVDLEPEKKNDLT